MLELRTDTKANTKQRVMLMSIRQALLIVLGAIEDYLELERSVIPKHKRRYEQD